MDKTERKMTKIARELNKLTVQTMKKEGILLHRLYRQLI